MADRYCPACDTFFRHRRDLRHTYEAPGCKHGGRGISPLLWTTRERETHAFVEEVEAELVRLDEESTHE